MRALRSKNDCGHFKRWPRLSLHRNAIDPSAGNPDRAARGGQLLQQGEIGLAARHDRAGHVVEAAAAGRVAGDRAQSALHRRWTVAISALKAEFMQRCLAAAFDGKIDRQFGKGR